jgi:AbrB family looped-hinge helix DNA binding protein
MPTYSAKVGTNGELQLPQELRDRLHIEEGSEVEFFLTLDGQVHFHALTGRMSEWGLPNRLPPISIREMDDGIAEAIAEKHARIRRQDEHPRKRSAAE